MSNSQLSGLIIFLSCQNLPFLRFFLKASKMIFDQKNEGFPLFHFTPVEEIFVVLKPYEKDREKQCFLILSSFSHNLTRKLIFSQKEWVRHQIWFAFCCWCIKMLFLMLYYTVKASKVLKFERQFNLVGVKLSRYPCSIVHSYFCSLHLRHVFLEPHNTTPPSPPFFRPSHMLCVSKLFVPTYFYTKI